MCRISQLVEGRAYKEGLQQLIRTADPPKDFVHNPPSIGRNRGGFVLAVFRDQYLGVVEALQAGNHKAVFLVGGNYDLTVKIVVTGLGSIDDYDVTVVNERHHGTAANSQ